ncbi:PAS domain S-box protein [Halonotius sp. GCM10025705]|uniref:PAS domain S-box protein n=1 Tax=Halonotius sp. GCM10025705 TaxID=3252678 RepID=UPI003612EED1
MHPIERHITTDKRQGEQSDSLQILYVEDDENFAALTKTCLEKEEPNFEITHVSDPTDGLNELTDTVDCIVSDYDLPEMDGLELLETVRETHSNIPFILFTGKSPEDIANEAISAGVTDYLQKGSGTSEFTLLANRVTNAVAQTHAEDALTRQKKRVEAVVSNLPVVLFAFDTQGTFTRFEGDSTDVYESDTEPYVGQSIFDVCADHEGLQSAAKQALSGEQTTAKHEFAANLYRTTFQPVFDATGAVESVLGVAIDITDREQNARKLKAERRRFQNLFAELSQPTVEIEYRNKTPIVKQVNPAFEAVFGYDGDDIVGESLDAHIVPADRRDSAAAINDHVCETGELISEKVTRETTDGTREFLLQNAVFDGGSRAFAIYTDITERQAHQHELEVLRTAIDNAHNPIVLTDPSQPDNPISYVNKAFEKVTGYTQSDALGRNCRFLQGKKTDAAKIEKLTEAIAAEEECTVELRNYRKDGTMFWNRLTIKPVYNEDGELIRYFSSQEDITDRKESRERLKQQNARLEEFAGTVSHDLRNPLNVAQGRLQVAQNECESDQLAPIADAHERMETLIDELLMLARQGETVSETTPVTLSSISSQCWQTVDTRDATLTVTTDQTISADRNRLQELFENLIRNAIEHGGSSVEITIGELDDNDGFYIADDGSGIPSVDHEVIFESGYTTDTNGTGLGLAIVADITEAHGWDVSVTESAEGGARFEFSNLR